MNKFHSGIRLGGLLAPQQQGVGTYYGTALDAKESRDVVLVFSSGSLGPNVYVDVSLQQSDDNSSWSDVSGASLTRYEPSDDNVLRLGRLHGVRSRYIRIKVTITAVAGLGFIAGFLLLGGNDYDTPDNVTFDFNIAA